MSTEYTPALTPYPVPFQCPLTLLSRGTPHPSRIKFYIQMKPFHTSPKQEKHFYILITSAHVFSLYTSLSADSELKDLDSYFSWYVCPVFITVPSVGLHYCLRTEYQDTSNILSKN